MSSLLKSTVLSLGILAGTAAVALAQSVSSLPPSGPATAPTVSTPSNSTNPADKWQHPYSTSVGPQPGSHSSGKDEHYQATEGDDAPSSPSIHRRFGSKAKLAIARRGCASISLLSRPAGAAGGSFALK